MREKRGEMRERDARGEMRDAREEWDILKK